MYRSASSNRREKPRKPRADFPLFPHATGRWAKKIKGRLHYFGPWADADGALAKYVQQRDDLYAGRKPRKLGIGLTVKELVKRFLTAKKARVEVGELTAGTFGDLYRACRRVLGVFDSDRLVEDLDADDFEALRANIAKTYGMLSRKVEIKRIRSLFRYAYDMHLIDKPVRFGAGFVGPSRREVRSERQKYGPRMFEAHEIRAMLAAASTPLKAMILLGVNCGFGNTDLANLSLSHLDLEHGWCNYPRPKTAIRRRCPLWPETIVAISAAIAERPTPNDKTHANLVFISPRGHMLVQARLRTSGTEAIDLTGPSQVTYTDRVIANMTPLLRRLGLTRRGLTFYALRHTFETIGGESRDQVAVDAIMGHSRDDMASVYRERISDERLLAVTAQVQRWLFGDA